jgi:phage baseplate assembly protein W
VKREKNKNMAGIAPKLPLDIDQTDGYRLTKTIKETVQQNLKMIVLTSPGERIMDPDFWCWLKELLIQKC